MFSLEVAAGSDWSFFKHRKGEDPVELSVLILDLKCNLQKISPLKFMGIATFYPFKVFYSAVCNLLYLRH
jgi:hypothetical protein